VEENSVSLFVGIDVSVVTGRRMRLNATMMYACIGEQYWQEDCKQERMIRAFV
jgi:hypothetical protein